MKKALIHNSISLMCIKMENEKLDIYTVGDMMDSAIIHLAENGLGKMELQKALFLYLLSLSIKKNYDFNKIVQISGFEPYKYGPFSDFVDGELEELSGTNDLEVSGTGNNTIIKSKPDKISEYKIDSAEVEIINNIKNLTEKLTLDELVFYVYFHPSIDKKVKEYFTSYSEIKDKLIRNKEKYVKALKKKDIIDDEAADLILYGS